MSILDSKNNHDVLGELSTVNVGAIFSTGEIVRGGEDDHE